MSWDTFSCAVSHHVAATMPYFLPLLLPPFGTSSAPSSKMKGIAIPDKKALFDIGAAGPLMGLFFAILPIIIGLNLSDVRPVPTDASQFFRARRTDSVLVYFQACIWPSPRRDGYLPPSHCLCRLGRIIRYS